MGHTSQPVPIKQRDIHYSEQSREGLGIYLYTPFPKDMQKANIVEVMVSLQNKVTDT